MKRAMILTMMIFGLAASTTGRGALETAKGQNGKPALVYATSSPPSLDFGNQQIQTLSKQLRVTLTNNARESVEIRGIDAQEGHWEDFEADDDECTGQSLAPGESCTVGVVFSPIGVGARSSFLFVAYAVDPDHPQRISLRGNGIKPSN